MSGEESIIKSIKKMLNLADDYDPFDTEVIIHIRSVFSRLCQLGVGPAQGFPIADETVTWDAFLQGDSRYDSVKSYVYLRLRLLFDPPPTSFAIESFKEQIKEEEWRLNVQSEGEKWTKPTTPSISQDS